MAIVYNHVSKNKDYQLTLERIDKYKSLLIEDALELYCNEISDDTIINDKSWKENKKILNLVSRIQAR